MYNGCFVSSFKGGQISLNNKLKLPQYINFFTQEKKTYFKLAKLLFLLFIGAQADFREASDHHGNAWKAGVYDCLQVTIMDQSIPNYFVNVWTVKRPYLVIK